MKIIKKFNTNEYTSWLLSKASPHNAIVVASITSSINEQKFREALNIAASSEANLKLSISPSHCGFITCKKNISIDFSMSLNTWQEAVENELNRNFCSGDTLLRVRVIKTAHSYYLLLCFHHIICDGKSAIEFLLNVLNIYNDSSYIVDKKISFRKDNFSLNTFPFQKWVSENNYNSNPNITKICGINISNNIIQLIINHAKLINQSINSILSSFIIESYRKSFKNNEKLNLHMSIDLRKIDGIKSNNLGFNTSWINMQIKNHRCLNELACTIRENLTRALQKNEHINNLIKLNNALNERIDDREFINQFISTSPVLAISNCGNILSKSTSRVKISEIHLAVNCQSYLGTHDSLIVTIATVNNDSLSINVCYPSPLVSSALITAFLNDLSNNIYSFYQKNIYPIKLHLESDEIMCNIS